MSGNLKSNQSLRLTEVHEDKKEKAYHILWA